MSPSLFEGTGDAEMMNKVSHSRIEVRLGGHFRGLFRVMCIYTVGFGCVFAVEW